jgi:hypothetical protein
MEKNESVGNGSGEEENKKPMDVDVSLGSCAEVCPHEISRKYCIFSICEIKDI